VERDPSKEAQLDCTYGMPHKDDCAVIYFAGQGVTLYRNLRDGRFHGVTVQAGIEAPGARVLGLTIVDYNQDGWHTLGMRAARSNQQGGVLTARPATHPPTVDSDDGRGAARIRNYEPSAPPPVSTTARGSIRPSAEFHVDAPRADRLGPCRGVFDDEIGHGIHIGEPFFPIIGVALHLDVGASHIILQLEGPGAHFMRFVIVNILLEIFFGKNEVGRVGQRPQERRGGVVQAKDDGVGVKGFDALDRLIEGTSRANRPLWRPDDLVSTGLDGRTSSPRGA
jgi:hypothetical protein